MEARASLNGSSVSKTFVAAVLVLVAMGLGAMGGYVAKGLGASGASTTVIAPVHPAAGTVLRQDNPPAAVAGSFHAAPGTVLRQDNPPANGRDDTPATQAVRGGTRGDFGYLP